MNRVHPLLLGAVSFVFVMAACSSASGPLSPEPLSKMTPGAGVEISQTRTAIIDFLNAYANSSKDDATALQTLVAPNSPADLWSRVIALQDHLFPGTSVGDVKISSIGSPASSQRHLQTTDPVRDIQLQASVGFTFKTLSGDTIQQSRVFDGPITLIGSASGSWQVYDFTRDGQPLEQVMAQVGGAPITKDGVTLRVLVEILDTRQWELVIDVQNTTSAPVTMGQTSVVLASGSSPVGDPGSVSASLDSIAPGSHALGLVAVAAPSPVTAGLAYVIGVSPPKGNPIQFALSVDKLRQLLTPASATPNPSQSPTSPFG